MGIVPMVMLFMIACFVGVHVVRSVKPALHMPLVALASAIGSIVIVGALIATAETSAVLAKYFGLAAITLVAINVFGGFAITERMLAVYRKRERK